jgi:hypothetical protein
VREVTERLIEIKNKKVRRKGKADSETKRAD